MTLLWIFKNWGGSFPPSLPVPKQTFVLVKAYWRCLQCNIFLSFKTSSRYNCKTSCKHVLNTSWKTSWKRLDEVLRRRLEDVLGRRIANTTWRRLKAIFQTSWNTSWRRLGKQEMFAGISPQLSLSTNY